MDQIYLTNSSSVEMTISYFQSKLGNFINLLRRVGSTIGAKADTRHLVAVIELHTPLFQLFPYKYTLRYLVYLDRGRHLIVVKKKETTDVR